MDSVTPSLWQYLPAERRPCDRIHNFGPTRTGLGNSRQRISLAVDLPGALVDTSSLGNLIMLLPYRPCCQSYRWAADLLAGVAGIPWLKSNFIPEQPAAISPP